MIGSWVGDQRLQGRQNGQNGQPDTSAFNIVNGRLFTPGLGIILAVRLYQFVHRAQTNHYAAPTLHPHGRRLSSYRARRRRRWQTACSTTFNVRPVDTGLQLHTFPHIHPAAEELHNLQHHDRHATFCRHHAARTRTNCQTHQLRMARVSSWRWSRHPRHSARRVQHLHTPKLQTQWREPLQYFQSADQCYE
jgi:hypothetical protein